MTVRKNRLPRLTKNRKGTKSLGENLVERLELVSGTLTHLLFVMCGDDLTGTGN